MLSSPHLQANQKSMETYGQWWNPFQCMHMLTRVTYTNVKRHIQSRRGVEAFIRERANLGGMKNVQHSVSLPVNLVRMMSVGAQEWINSIWRDDEVWPLRVRCGGARTLRAVWVAECHGHTDKDLRACGCLFRMQWPGGDVHIGGVNATITIKLWHGAEMT